MEKGFYHPDRGYWQTVGTPSAAILKTYPKGTIEVPLIPDSDYEWIDGEWVHVPAPDPTNEELRANMPRLSATQFRIGLVNFGFTPENVNEVIDAISDEKKRIKTQIKWEYETYFKRLDPVVITLTSALFDTEEDVDTFWEEAYEL